MSGVDLAAAAEGYGKSIGLSDAGLSALKANLSKDYSAAAPKSVPIPESVADPEPTPTPEPDAELEPASAPAPSVTTYTVISGDCLWSIAAKLYGQGIRWTEIYALNKTVVMNPGMIYIGQVLAVPAA